MFCHINDMSLDYRKLLIVTVDTDLVVIALAVFFSLSVDELWIEFGSGKDRKWIPIHLYAHVFGKRRYRALPFWYAFTGCDTTSQFAGHGKKSAWKIWTDIPDITDTFIR